jgi:hypothetical protein
MIHAIIYIIKKFGIKYFLFRVLYEVAKKLQLFPLFFPTADSNKYRRGYLEKFQDISHKGMFTSKKNGLVRIKVGESFKKKSKRILRGDRQFFYSKWYKEKDLGDWNYNPATGKSYSMVHWSLINQLDTIKGDIKYVWQKSRFDYIQDLIIYFENEKDEKVLSYILKEILDWIKFNKRNIGPNWCCSQEIALRIINWAIFLFFFKKELVQKHPKETDLILRSIQDQILHVEKNIIFSTIAVRNNHAFSENLGIFTIYTLFPFFKKAEKKARKGFENFIKEVEFQIFEDGTDSQYSLNYLRNKIQLISIFLSVANDKKIDIDESFFSRIKNTLEFLCSVVSPEGRVPNFGANDGSLPYSFHDNFKFSNYYPQINTLHQILYGDKYKNDEESDYSFIFDSLKELDKIEIGEIRPLNKGVKYYKGAGYFLFRFSPYLLFIHSGELKFRPSQPDMLHIDLWKGDCNILCDTGTYSYNSKGYISEYIGKSISHNVPTLNSKDHMLKFHNFMWLRWSEVLTIDWKYENEKLNVFCDMNAYEYIDSEIKIERNIKFDPREDILCIIDKIKGKKFKENDVFEQNWHSPLLNIQDKIVSISNHIKKSDIKIATQKAYRSSIYGSYDEINHITISSKSNTISVNFDFSEI